MNQKIAKDVMKSAMCMVQIWDAVHAVRTRRAFVAEHWSVFMQFASQSTALAARKL